MSDFLQVTSFDPLIVQAPQGVHGDQGQQGVQGNPGPTGPTGPTGAGISGPGTADGQLLAWSTILGQYTPSTPPGNAELAYAENVSGVTTNLASGGSADVTGCVISVPACSRPVWLQGRVHFKPTAAGVGLLQLQLLETTGGSLTLLEYSGAALHGETPTAVEQLGYPVEVRLRLGPTASTRTFKLLAALFADSGTPAAVVLNAAQTPSFLLAEQK